MAIDDLFEHGSDKMEVDPPDLGRLVTDVITISLAKQLAEAHQKPWTDKLESQMQEKISALVAAAKERGLKTVRLIVTRKSGAKVMQELDVEKISKTRSLQ